MENYNCHLVIWSGIITLVFATEFLWNENGYLNFGQKLLAWDLLSQEAQRLSVDYLH